MAEEAPSRVELNDGDKGSLVEALWHAVDHGAGSLAHIPGLVRRVIETGAWERRTYKGKVYEHARFLDFITAKPLGGCGWEPDKVEALIKDQPEVLAMWREAVTPEAHRPAGSNDIVITSQQGNSKSYTLDRLKREAPALFAAVCAGELSANAAAIEAGFRKKPTPFETVQKLLPKLTATEKRKLRDMLA